MEQYVEVQLAEHRAVLEAVVEELQPSIIAAGRMIADALARGGKLLLFGNGGSAADSQHIAAEFVGRFELERRGLPAIALTTDSSTLTAISNDFGYENAFARQVEALGRPEDVLVGISTSGSSPNVIKALETGRAAGLRCIALTGTNSELVDPSSDVVLAISSDTTARVQEMHIMIGHVLAGVVEQLLQQR